MFEHPPREKKDGKKVWKYVESLAMTTTFSLLLALGANKLDAQTNTDAEWSKNREKEKSELMSEISKKDNEIENEIYKKHLSVSELGSGVYRFQDKKTGSEFCFGTMDARMSDDPKTVERHMPVTYLDVEGEWKGNKVRFRYVDRCSSGQLGQVDRFIIEEEPSSTADEETVNELYQITFDGEKDLQNKAGLGKKIIILDFKDIDGRPFYMVYNLDENGFYGKDDREDMTYKLWLMTQQEYLQDLTKLLEDVEKLDTNEVQ